MNRLIFALLLTTFAACGQSPRQQLNTSTDTDTTVYVVAKSDDFEVNGRGDNPNWNKASWMELVKRKQHENNPLKTTVKMLYSEKGLYFLYYCEDYKLTASLESDFSDLWNEDVVEVFLKPDANDSIYFEYELSPLNYELAILVANQGGELLRWQPFYYEANRQTRRATSIIGGEKKNGASIEAWIAEFFIPYKLLVPLVNNLPSAGMRWKANFYRLDYDDSEVSWLWKLTRRNFHDYKSFGTILFQ